MYIAEAIDPMWAERYYFMADRYRQVAMLPGCIVECGVGSGSSLSALASAVRTIPGLSDRPIYGYDAFATPLHDLDVFRLEDEPPPPDGIPLEHVLKLLEHAGWDMEHPPIRLIPGLLHQTLPKTPPPEPIALLHLDVDIYHSYQVALKHLWPKVMPQGVVILDEYHRPKWFGADKAVNEFLDSLPVEEYGLHKGFRWWISKEQ